MMNKRFLLQCIAVVGLLCSNQVISQAQTGYQTPPKEMADLLLAKPIPTVSIDGKAEWMVQMERNPYLTVEELGQPELRVAGLRLNPHNFSASRQSFINKLVIKQIKTNKELTIVGLPMPLAAANVRWSPNEKKIAFTQHHSSRVDLYVIDLATAKATKVNAAALNLVTGNGFVWLDDNTLLYKTAIAPASAAPKKPIKPIGPAIQENIGKAAPGRTYQDLIKTPYDEQVFEFMATAQLVSNTNGVETYIGKPAIYASFSPSPDKQYLLVETIAKPFSYLVPVNGFASTVSIVDKKGKLVKELAKLPSSETTPSGYDNVQNVPRNFDWRDDEPATVTWIMPLDSGMIRKKQAFHDAVWELKAPFTRESVELFQTQMRCRNIIWGNDQFAWVTEALIGKQTIRTSRYNPSTKQLETLFERNTTDAYNDAGTPVTVKNIWGRNVIKPVNNIILLNNTTGASSKGDRPFLAAFDIQSKKSDILWRCSGEQFEFVAEVIDPEKLVLLTRRESQREVPNYYVKNLKLRMADIPLTKFSNPYTSLEGVTKEKITYKRADGVDLSADLYLPKGYNKETDGELPVLMWAYPREFNSAADAAQIRGSQYRFTTLSWASPVFYVTQGFAVLDNAEMPIVATDPSKKPNDNFVEQLQMNAEAAIRTLSEMRVGDRNRVAVGGHSYGAFMTANLLAHTQLFKAGIARSGAYNRTLTPFGFQNEDRTYWQAPQLYYEMSPFSYADKIKTPLLLIHGDSDDNPGTFPINSERLYNAVKGHGGTVRFVFLPYEAHSYRGKENLLHMLWEQYEWLTKYVKNSTNK